MKHAFHKRALGFKRELSTVLRDLRTGRLSRSELKIRFIVFSRPRSGSTLLVSMLNSHPDIDCLGEIFQYPPAFSAVAMAERSLQHLQASRRGFKLLSYQAQQQMYPGHVAALRKWIVKKDVVVIHLQRRNTLRQVLSNIYAHERKIFHSTRAGTSVHRSIRVDPDQLIRQIDLSEKMLAWEKAFIGDLRHEEVVYESDLSQPADQQAVLDRLLIRLGLDPVASKTALKLVTPRELSGLVENWDEVQSRLYDSPWAGFLSDET